MGTAKGMIFDVKRFAVHDGPGMRTPVFFKGCPLRCSWCHNPEGISPSPEIMVFADRCLKGCRDCLPLCPQGALKKARGAILLDRSLCDGCGACAEACPAEALRLAGRQAGAAEVMAEIVRDLPFYRRSGGGATFSGGEPLAQPGFLLELLDACREEGISAAIDTSGHAPFALFERILPLVDLFLYDVKLIDAEGHQRWTDAGNSLILGNLDRLSRSGAGIAIRVPLVPGVNDSPRELEALADFSSSLPRRHPVHLLPFHRGHAAKRRRLGLEAALAGTAPPNGEALQRAAVPFRRRGLDVLIGG